MRPITNEDIKVLGRIVNISTENVVADASQVYDSNLHKDQQWLNDYLYAKTGNATTSKYGIVRLATGKNDPDNNDVPTIKILRDAIQDAISFILEDPGNSLLDNLNSIKELADALNNDPSFWTWVRDQLALKADKSAFDTLVGRVDNLNQRVTYLEECCQQMHEYVNEFSVTWNQARGGNHVTITPGYVRIGSSVVEINMDPNYVWEVDTTNASQLHTLLLNCMDGDYDSFTITNVTRQAGFVNGMTLNFVGVRSNITINGNVYKLGTVTARVTGGTASPVSQTWGNPTNNTRMMMFTITPSSGYTSLAIIPWSIKDANNVAVYTGTTDLRNVPNGPFPIQFQDSISAISNFQDYTLEITLPAVYTITYPTNTTEVSVPSSAPTTVIQGGSFSTTLYPIGNYLLDTTTVTVGGQLYSTIQTDGRYHEVTVTNATGNVVITTTVRSGVYNVSKNISHVTWSGPSANVSTISRLNTHDYDATVTPSSGYQIDSITVTMGGTDITSSAYTSGTGRIYINVVTDDIVITGTTSQSGTTPTYGTVTISPDHGTASPSTFSADGASHTITITPASGYTTTGMTATSNNNDVSVSVSGNKITVTGTSSNNATITVALPAEGTPTPSGPALSGTTSASDSFNAFGRVEPLHYSQQDNLDVYDWGTSDPYTYGTEYVEANLGDISNFTGLTGSDNSQKLNDLKTKLNYDYFKVYSLSGGSPTYYYQGVEAETMPSSGTTATNTACPFEVADVVLDGSNVILKISCLPADLSGSVTTETLSSGTAYGNIEFGEDPQVAISGAYGAGSTRQYVAGSRYLSDLKVTYTGDDSYTYVRLTRNVYGINYPSMLQISPAGSIVPGAQWYFNASLSYVAPECAFEPYDENNIDYTEGSGSLHHYTIGDANWAIYPTGTSNAVTLGSVEAKYQGNGAYYYRVMPATALADGTYDLAMSYTSSNPSQYPSLAAKSIEGLTISSN